MWLATLSVPLLAPDHGVSPNRRLSRHSFQRVEAARGRVRKHLRRGSMERRTKWSVCQANIGVRSKDAFMFSTWDFAMVTASYVLVQGFKEGVLEFESGCDSDPTEL